MNQNEKKNIIIYYTINETNKKRLYSNYFIFFNPL